MSSSPLASSSSIPWASALPVLGAMAYPALLAASFHSARWVGYAGPAGALALALSLTAVFAVPALGLCEAIRLSGPARSAGHVRLRGVACLVVAVPALYTFIGVETDLLHIARFENNLWIAAWCWILWLAQRAERDHDPVRTTPSLPTTLRVAHGIGAALLLFGYIAIHVSNHLAGLWGAETHLALMDVLRRWYRHPLVEPVLVLLVLAQVGTGMRLLRGWLSRDADVPRTLQVATGAYLGLYIICHLNSTFVYARAALGIDTNFWFASGGAAGLLGGAWSVRLLPHYAVAVLALVLHLSAGLRVVVLAHGTSPARVAWLLPAGWIAGAAVAIGAVLPLVRVHPF
jgi:hypothetical protein